MSTIEIKKVTKQFGNFTAVRDADLSVKAGEVVCLLGPSGCGKSTLLYILSTMDTDYEGDIYLDDIVLPKKSDRILSQVRNEKIGFVFQFHYLIPYLSLIENIQLRA